MNLLEFFNELLKSYKLGDIVSRDLLVGIMGSTNKLKYDTAVYEVLQSYHALMQLNEIKKNLGLFPNTSIYPIPRRNVSLGYDSVIYDFKRKKGVSIKYKCRIAKDICGIGSSKPLRYNSLNLLIKNYKEIDVILLSCLDKNGSLYKEQLAELENYKEINSISYNDSTKIAVNDLSYMISDNNLKSYEEHTLNLGNAILENRQYNHNENYNYLIKSIDKNDKSVFSSLKNFVDTIKPILKK